MTTDSCEVPEISNPCFVCGRDMDSPETGMFERADSNYECESCHTAQYDRDVDKFQARLDALGMDANDYFVEKYGYYPSVKHRSISPYGVYEA